MTNGLGLRNALTKLRRLPYWSRLTRPIRRPPFGLYVGCMVTGIVVLTLGIGTALVIGFNSVALGMIAYFAVPTICTVVWVLALPMDAASLSKSSGQEPLPTLSVPLRLLREDPGEPVDTVRGRVRLHEAVRSPLGGERCAAFRLLGKAGRIEIDDSGLGRFDVVVDGEVGAVVASKAAGVRLEMAEPAPVEATEGLSAFLFNRGAGPADPLVLAEAVLRDGDEVAVSGRGVMVPQADGRNYRGSLQVMTFQDTLEDPVSICRG